MHKRDLQLPVIKAEAVSILLLLGIMTGSAGYGQSETYHVTGVAGHYGFVIPHSRKIAEFAGTQLYGFSLDFRRIDTSEQKWKVFNSYWFSGVEAGYYRYGKPDVLGSSVVLSVLAEPVLSHGNRHMLTARGGIGPAYLTRLYDSITNPSNLFFSTRIGFILHLSARISYRINQDFSLNVSANYNHISNGGVKQPNLGMNFPTLAAGLQYFPGSFPELSQNHRNDIVIRRGLTWSMQALTGYRVVSATDQFPEKGAMAIGFNVRISRQLTRYYGLNAGGEMIFDGAIRETIRRSDLDIDYKRAALTVGQDFLFGNAIFTQYFGIYVYSPYKARNSTYQKYELSFRINDNLLAGFYLKAHSYFAELMGIHLGVTL